MAWYDIDFVRKDEDGNVVMTSSFCFSLDQGMVERARREKSEGKSQYWQVTLAKRIYVRWKTTKPEGRRMDDGTCFTYDELTIEERKPKRLPPDENGQQSLFDEL